MPASACGATAPAAARAAAPAAAATRRPAGAFPAARPFRGAAHSRQSTAAAALNRRELLGSGAAAAALLPAGVAAAQGGVQAAGSAATVAAASAASAAVEQGELRMEVDANGVQRLALQPQGWNTWRWRGHAVNWLAAGDSGPAVLLIHGFGASAYHWRYNVPELAKHCRVYALDCLGFGWSDKPLVEYSGYGLWTDQISDFIREVVGPNERVVLVGNSLGGYNALATAAKTPELVRGVVLLNAAGRFEEGGEAGAGASSPAATEAQQSLWSGLVDQVVTAGKRAVVFASFIFTKQPARIRQVLGQVYVSDANIDDDLVKSISLPAQHPNAAEVFYRVITARGEPMNRLLDRLDGLPVYLLWGERDPWCVPTRADQIQRYYPAATRTDINSGHCPHDDTPELVNERLLRWVTSLPAQTA